MIGKTKTEEQLAIEAEHSAIFGSINSAKNELVIIANDKKRVAQEKIDLETGNTKLIDDKSSLEDAIHILVDTKSQKEQELKDLEKEYVDKKITLEAGLPDTEKVLADLESKKIPIQGDISHLSQVQLESQKSLETVENKIEDSKTELIDIEKSIEAKNIREDELIKSIDKKQKEQSEIQLKIDEYNTLVSGNETRKNVLASINKEIIEAESKLSLMKTEGIKELETELAGLKNSINKNKEINKSEESRHFALLNKQQALDSKESFIKSQYERAGIKWEE
jgi:chromosome segregation ATPase